MLSNNQGIQDLKQDGFTQREIDKLIKNLKLEFPLAIVKVSCKFMIVKGISCKSWAIKEIVKELWNKDVKLKKLRRSKLVSNVQFFVAPEQRKNVIALANY